MQKRASLLLKIFYVCVLCMVIFSVLHTYMILRFFEPEILHFVPGAYPVYILYALFALFCAFILIFYSLKANCIDTAQEDGPFETFANVLCAVIFLSCFIFLAFSLVKYIFIDNIAFSQIGYMPLLTAFFSFVSGLYFLFLCSPIDKKVSDTGKAYLSLAPSVFTILLMLERLLDTDAPINSPLKNLHIVSLCAMTIYLLYEAKLRVGKVFGNTQKNKLCAFGVLCAATCIFITLPHTLLCAFWIIDAPYSLIFNMAEIALIFPALARAKELAK